MIGRSPEATIMIEEPSVSRRHARIVRTAEGGFVVEDLGSRNGTFVNGRRVAAHPLGYGDKIRIGPEVVFELQRFDPAEDHIIQRQRFEAVGRLGVGIAHDLKNLLAAFDAGCSFLSESSRGLTLSDSDVRACIADLVMAAERCGEIARGVLSFAGGREPNRTCLDLGTLVREVVRMLRYAFGRDIELQASIESDVLVHGNRSDLQQVLFNLCLNARDAMPEGGVLRIGTRALPVAPPDAIWRPGHPLAILTVADTGVGMDDSTRDRIFEPFFTTKGEGRGYGLGLASVREIVALHGGLVAVESQKGHGSTFTIYLPLVEPDGGRLSSTLDRQAVSPHRPLPSSASILLVDDEQIVRRSVARRLRQAGFEVTEAADGHEALENYRQRPYTLVLLDLDMPGLDGEKTRAQLAEFDPGVRVVYATGYADADRAAHIRAQGVLALLDKPYDIEELVDLAVNVVQGLAPDVGEPDTQP